MAQRLGVGLGVLLAGLALPDAAAACGGLFCSSSNPVNQAAERIIFAQDGERISAVIEIQYQGPAEAFAWVLPIPAGDVTVGVSSKQALDALQQQSNPQYNLQTRSTCNQGRGSNSALAADEAQAGSDFDGNVNVVESGTAGPYDYVQLRLDESLEAPADVAINWLEEAGFDTSNLGRELLGPYLEQGMDLLAFRLTKGNDVGSIRPVLLKYSAANPVIPIRPTAVAANPDMGVMVWVLGNARAVPVNYLHLELNEAKINWFNAGPTYNDVVIAAADEAGGQGFVTEQSGEASFFGEVVYPGAKEDAFAALRQNPFSSQAGFFRAVISAATSFDLSTFSEVLDDGLLDVLSDPNVLPLRGGATPEQFALCPECYFDPVFRMGSDRYPSTQYDAATDPMNAFDAQLFLNELEEKVVLPFQETRALFETHDTVTRFYTTLSPDEMTEDPVFDFNSDLGPVSNVHNARQLLDCDGNWRIDLPQGGVLEGSGNTWPIALNDDTMAMNFRILQLSTSGQGEVLIDNRDAILDATTPRSSGFGGLCTVATRRGVPNAAVADSATNVAARHFTAWLAFAALFGLSRRFRRSSNVRA